MYDEDLFSFMYKFKESKTKKPAKEGTTKKPVKERAMKRVRLSLEERDPSGIEMIKSKLLKKMSITVRRQSLSLKPFKSFWPK